jgi:hypothetical protein
MDSKQKELWDRLENEPERAYRAFESFLTLPSSERTIINAYRTYVGNPDAVKASDTWSGWSSHYAWRERAAAYDDHMASKRREAYERGMEEEAERQGALAERTRGRKNELMTAAYEQTIEWFENTDFSDLRPSDVIQIIKLHIEDVKNEAVHIQSEEPTWTEEDDAEFTDRILSEIEAQRAQEESEEDSGEDPESDDSEEGPEETG